MLKKIAISFSLCIIFSIFFWILINIFSDFIFLTEARSDGEPHKARYIFNTWIILSVLIFLIPLVKFKRKKSND